MTEILMARDDQVLKKALNLSDVAAPATALANLGGQASDTDLTAIAALTTTGVMARTGAGAYSTRTLTAPAAGFTVTDGDGVSGNPTFVLADDLAALEGLATTGLAVRSAADTWLTRSITVPAAGLGIADADGVAGNPTLSLTNDLSALEALAGTGIAVRSAADTWVQRSIAVGSADLTVTNADGVAGNPTLDLGFTVTTAGKALIDDAAASNQRTTLGLGDLAVESAPLPVNKGGTGLLTIVSGGVMFGQGTGAIATTGVLGKGSIIVGDGAAAPLVRTVGANDEVLTADSAQADGVKWAVAAAPGKLTLIGTLVASASLAQLRFS